MDYEEFKQWLDKNNMSLKDFSEETSLSYSGCSKWKNAGIPSWVGSWCRLYDENRNLIKLKELARQILEDE